MEKGDESEIEESKSKSDKRHAMAAKVGTMAVDVSKNILSGLTQVAAAAIGVEVGSKSHGVILSNSHDAKMLAKKLFQKLQSGPVENIFQQDFDPYFKNPDDSTAAFMLFDKDGNQDISKQEMKNEVLAIYNERKHLEKSIRSSSQAIGKLDSILKVIAMIIILFISLSLWNIDTTKFLTSLITVWAGLIFAIGGTLKNMFDSCIFLFITHPYGKTYYIHKQFIHPQCVNNLLYITLNT